MFYEDLVRAGMERDDTRGLCRFVGVFDDDDAAPGYRCACAFDDTKAGMAVLIAGDVSGVSSPPEEVRETGTFRMGEGV